MGIAAPGHEIGHEFLQEVGGNTSAAPGEHVHASDIVILPAREEGPEEFRSGIIISFDSRHHVDLLDLHTREEIAFEIAVALGEVTNSQISTTPGIITETGYASFGTDEIHDGVERWGGFGIELVGRHEPLSDGEIKDISEILETEKDGLYIRNFSDQQNPFDASYLKYFPQEKAASLAKEASLGDSTPKAVSETAGQERQSRRFKQRWGRLAIVGKMALLF